MAVTVVSKPIINTVNTVSNGFFYTVQSDKTSESNFRFTFRIVVDGVDRGTKQVPATGTDTTVDLQEVLKPFISNDPEYDFINGGSIKPFWTIDDVDYSFTNPSIQEIDIFVGDQYELNNAIITSELPADEYVLSRGFTDNGEEKYEYISKFRPTADNLSLVQRMERGQDYVAQFNLNNLALSPGALKVAHIYYDAAGAIVSSGSYTRSILLVGTKRSLFCFVPVGANAVDPIASNVVRVEFTISEDGGTGHEILWKGLIYDSCREMPITLVFRNKYFQWSSLTFDGVNSLSNNRTNDRWESITEGLIDNNVKSHDSWTLNTQYMTEDEASEMQELFLSEEVYIQEGSGTRVVVDQQSWSERTRRRDKLIQYTFRVRKSARVFKA